MKLNNVRINYNSVRGLKGYNNNSQGNKIFKLNNYYIFSKIVTF